jgi:hypothetical protein
MVGVQTGNRGILRISSDGEHWSESAQPMTHADVWSRVAFAGERFFAFGSRSIGVSDDGATWTTIAMTQAAAAAYGNGRYLLVGSGPMRTSEDGLQWQEHHLDCSLPPGCAVEPAGVYAGLYSQALFAEGSFFVGELTSLDGATWQAEPGPVPTAYFGGHFLGRVGRSPGLTAWTRGGPVQTLRLLRPVPGGLTAGNRRFDEIGLLDVDAPLPETVTVEFEDGASCENADCVVVDGRLLLVPRPGTPALVDREPRDADGAVLLTDQCPVSSMIFCDDYVVRTGCECRTDAPPGPEHCQDVSQYRCAGQLVAQGNESPLDDLAQAGCTCDAVDPNQPAGFGGACVEGDDTCQAPLECLGVDAVPGGPDLRSYVCSSRCAVDADCPSWQATGFCSGPVSLRCSDGTCQPRGCD